MPLTNMQYVTGAIKFSWYRVACLHVPLQGRHEIRRISDACLYGTVKFLQDPKIDSYIEVSHETELRQTKQMLLWR